ncbi:alcohol dehydrogenase [Xylanimonas oleitrophica]|uniref:Alcohol dehydrogenase n=1 Tax=Xylanimonas oleitrophica TaxID=2607479 RepID=A0A2W5WYS0_9MICO|nr:alcohol dehydrogenase catalytic domain-containing protein [Xylanimonas oleitrophica]PZR53476.1 alcohol dehydrogenase [Xylanimonas oleitrophica]
MKVARLHAVSDLRVAEEPPPTPGPGEVLVRVTAVGLCGSDLHWFAEGGIGDAGLSDPLVLGHEFAGVIASGPDEGVHVAVDPAIPCGHCEMCVEGHGNLCPQVRFAGHGSTDGALREYVAWPADRLHPVPDSLSPADTAMLEPLGVAIHSVDLAHPRTGETVVVVGCGPIGLCALQVARAAGATTVVAVEPMAHRREAAARWADVVLDPTQEDYEEAMAAAVAPLGAHRVIECAGTDEAVALSIEAARPGATVVLAGIPEDDSTTFPAAPARRKGLTFRMARRMKEVYPRAISLVANGRVDVASIVSHTFSLDDAAEAFEVANRREGLKVVIAP